MERKNLCSKFKDLCPIPPAVPLNLASWFAKPKPDPLPPPKQPSGERLKVLHISDTHIDPREHALSQGYAPLELDSPQAASILGYATGAEANRSQGLCCRDNAWNTHSPDQVLLPAPRYGAYQW